MTTEAFKIWILSLFSLIQPKAPWADTYDASADVIAKAAMASPIFDGADGAAKTAAVLVSLGWFEGALRQDAAGDCDEKKPDGTCAKGGRPRSFCMFQIGESNFAALGITREQIQTDFDICVASAIRMIRISFGVCRGRPLEEKLGHYASGGSDCGGLAASRNRIRKGLWLFRSKPLPSP